MIPYDFRYVRPDNGADAVTLLSDHPELTGRECMSTCGRIMTDARLASTTSRYDRTGSGY